MEKSKNPQDTRNQRWPDPGSRLKRQVESQDVVQLCGEDRERQRNEEARQQEQTAEHLQRKERGGEVGGERSPKELSGQRIRGWSW